MNFISEVVVIDRLHCITVNPVAVAALYSTDRLCHKIIIVWIHTFPRQSFANIASMSMNTDVYFTYMRKYITEHQGISIKYTLVSDISFSVFVIWENSTRWCSQRQVRFGSGRGKGCCIMTISLVRQIMLLKSIDRLRCQVISISTSNVKDRCLTPEVQWYFYSIFCAMQTTQGDRKVF